MRKTFVFVYTKEDKIKVLNQEDAREQHVGLLRSGWKHTTTFDLCVFIQHLHNDCDNIRKKVKSLSTNRPQAENKLK